MRKTIKKILKEQTEGNQFTKFELHVLNYMYDKLEGQQIREYIKNRYDYGRFLRHLNDTFALPKKMLSEILYLYQHNYLGSKFEQRNDVNRKEAKKYRVTFFYDVNAWAPVDFEVYGTDEDSAYEITDAAEYMGDDSLVINKEYGDVEVGDWGEVYETEIEPLEETIKRELNLLKENTERITDKLLINICKYVENWLEDGGFTWDDLDSGGWAGGETYGDLIRDVMNFYGLSEEDCHYVLATYAENYERINRDWSELLDTGIIKAKKIKWNGSKEFGASQWVSQTATEDAYSAAELNYYDYDGYIDWEDNYINTHDTWDEDVQWEKA